MSQSPTKSIAIIVAHPDDETLWAGGIIMLHPEWKCHVICLCRKSDADRASKFNKVMNILELKGVMGNLDDDPEQKPLEEKDVEKAILELLPEKAFDLIITHNPKGEYTRHLRHEEVGKAVINLWFTGKIVTPKLWTFAYSDNNKEYYPKAMENTSLYLTLPSRIWNNKYKLITETYGFTEDSWEAKTTPKAEAFWEFSDPKSAKYWMERAIIMKPRTKSQDCKLQKYNIK